MGDIEALEVVVLFAGVAIGWLIQWLLDLFYFRGKRVCSKAEEALRSENQELVAENQSLKSRASACAECEATVVELRSAVSARDERITRLQTELSEASTSVSSVHSVHADADVDVIVERLMQQLEVANAATLGEFRRAVDERYDAIEARIDSSESQPQPVRSTDEPVSDDQPVSEQPAEVDAPPSLGPAHNSLYRIEHRWEGAGGGWRAGGAWVLGGRGGRPIVELECAAEGEGAIVGSVTYAEATPTPFRATKTGHNTYRVDEQPGIEGAPLAQGVTWLIGARWDHDLAALQLTSDDGGATLEGTCQYRGEEPLSFRGQADDGVVYEVDSQFSDLRNLWVIGSDPGRPLRSLRCTSDDDGRTFVGVCSYDAKTVSDLRCARWAGNTYHAETRQRGSASWEPAGMWVVGSSGEHNVVAFELRTQDDDVLSGPVTYEDGVVDVVHCRPATTGPSAVAGALGGLLDSITDVVD